MGGWPAVGSFCAFEHIQRAGIQLTFRFGLYAWTLTQPTLRLADGVVRRLQMKNSH